MFKLTSLNLNCILLKEKDRIEKISIFIYAEMATSGLWQKPLRRFLRHSNDVTKLNVKCFILNRCDRRTSRHWSLLSYEYIVVGNIDLSLRQPKDGGKIIITNQAYYIFERGMKENNIKM